MNLKQEIIWHDGTRTIPKEKIKLEVSIHWAKIEVYYYEAILLWNGGYHYFVDWFNNE